jgi:hypothetical protein
MKQNKLAVLSVFILLTCILTSCNVNGLIPSSSSTNATPISGTVLFVDDFSNPASGWFVGDSDFGNSSYVDGTYQIAVIDPSVTVWRNVGKEFTNTSTTVNATKVLGPDNNVFGVVCRFKDKENFYFSEVASDGYYVIGKYINGVLTNIGSDAMVGTTLVKAGSEPNQLRFDCNGNALTLYINGELASTVTDSDLTSGDVGLIAGTFTIGGLIVAFDNFVIVYP